MGGGACANAAARQRRARRARLAWYGLAALGAVGLTRHVVSAFVPVPSEALVPKAAAADRLTAAVAAAGAAALVPAEALAKGGMWGPLEGKASSLVHPLVMPLLFLVTLYTGFLGLQWRQTRLIGVELSDLRKELPKDLDPEAVPSSTVKAIQDRISELTVERTELIRGQFKDRHYQLSSLLLGGGIFFTFYGAFNTWFRADKLFPGPHLFAGCAICVGWALAGACVPFMEKGNEAARNLHIALNVVILGLFAWQLPTGFEILLKVWGNANLPWF